MISLAEARALIQANIRPLAAQTLPLGEAFGRVLREDVRAREDMPAFDRSAMDGYAVALDDDSKQFRVVGEIQPGAAPAFKINRGEAARIFTGAQIPEGASQVLMQENVRVEANSITPLQRNRTTHIRRRGEDARTGDLLLKSSSRLGAGELALLASLGVVQPRASALCRIAHFVTGNELVDPAHEPKPGQIRDSNGTLIAALVRQFGGDLGVRTAAKLTPSPRPSGERVGVRGTEFEIVGLLTPALSSFEGGEGENDLERAPTWALRQERVVDDFDLLFKKAREVENKFDLLLVSGGASVGDYDFGRRLLTTLGFQIHFEKINLRPGKPLIFATRGNQAAFILPGNPVSHFVVFHVAVRLALELFVDAPISWPLAQVQLADKFDYRPDPRETYWPARVVLEQGKLVARAVRWQSSGDVTGMAGANALLQFTSATQTLEAGSVVNALLLDVP